MTGFRLMPLELFPPFERKLADLMSEVDSAADGFREALISRAWNELHAVSGTLAGLAHQCLQEIQSRSDLEDAWGPSLAARDRDLKERFAALATDSSPEGDAARAALLEQLTDSLGDAAAAQAQMDEILAGTGPVFESRKNTKKAVAADQELLVSSYQMLEVLANRAILQASLHLAHASTTALVSDAPEGGDESIVDDEIAALKSIHATAVERLYTLLAAEVDPDEFLTACVAEGSSIQNRLPTSGMILGGYLAMVANVTSDDARAQFMAKSLELVEYIQRLSVVHSYTKLVRAEMATVDPGRWYSAECRRVDSRNLDSAVPQGTLTALEHVAAEADGNFIRVSGEVKNIEIRDDPTPPKFSTFFDLADASSGHELKVRAHMFSLINNGLADGAHTTLNGYVRTNPSWNSDVGLDIDRVSLTELRRDSWYDDLTHRVRTYCQLYLDEMNMFFTPTLFES